MIDKEQMKAELARAEREADELRNEYWARQGSIRVLRQLIEMMDEYKPVQEADPHPSAAIEE
jgi:hypothetical protein